MVWLDFCVRTHLFIPRDLLPEGGLEPILLRDDRRLREADFSIKDRLFAADAFLASRSVHCRSAPYPLYQGARENKNVQNLLHIFPALLQETLQAAGCWRKRWVSFFQDVRNP